MGNEYIYMLSSINIPMNCDMENRFLNIRFLKPKNVNFIVL